MDLIGWICSPVPWTVYRELLEQGALPHNADILDIGCGKGGILAKAIELCGGTGTGVELGDGPINEPTLTAQKLEVTGKLKFIYKDVRIFFENLNRSFDLVLCIGSSHALGGSEQVFSAARKL